MAVVGLRLFPDLGHAECHKRFVPLVSVFNPFEDGRGVGPIVEFVNFDCERLAQMVGVTSADRRLEFKSGNGRRL